MSTYETHLMHRAAAVIEETDPVLANTIRKYVWRKRENLQDECRLIVDVYARSQDVDSFAQGLSAYSNVIPCSPDLCSLYYGILKCVEAGRLLKK